MHCVPINDLPYRALLARSLTLENLRAKTGCLVCLDGRCACDAASAFGTLPHCYPPASSKHTAPWSPLLLLFA